MNTYETVFVIFFMFLMVYAVVNEAQDLNGRTFDTIRNSGDINLIPAYVVYWRRCLLIAIMITIMFFYLFRVEFNLRNFLIGILVIYTILYYQFNFYLYHLNLPLYNMFDCKVKV